MEITQLVDVIQTASNALSVSFIALVLAFGGVMYLLSDIANAIREGNKSE